jgi:hypothetical protein
MPPRNQVKFRLLAAPGQYVAPLSAAVRVAEEERV